MKAGEKEEKRINIAAFFIYGVVTFTMEMFLVTATEDILSGTSVPSATLLLTIYLPHTMCAAILPYLTGRISQLATSVSIFLFFTIGLLLVALPAELEWRFIGVACIGVGAGISDTLVIGFTARYSDITVHAYVGGCGLSGILTNIFYTGMTTWLCVSPRILPLIFLAAPPLVLIFYWLMDKRQPDKANSEASDRRNVAYSALRTVDEEEHSKFTSQDKLQVIRDMKLLISSLFVGSIAKWVTLEAVVTTLAFPGAPFGPREHYQYYILAYLIANFIGRSYVLFLSFFKCSETTLVTSHTWIISTVIFALQMILVFASWFRFLPNVHVVLAIVFLFGLMNGGLYCNSFSVASRGSGDRHIEYGRAFLTIALSTGVVSAALLGLFIEEQLMEHCLHTFSQNEYCLTRWGRGWNDSLSCPTYL